MRDDPELAPEYEKDPDYEAWLETFNDQLLDIHDQEYRDIDNPFPNLYIIGPPRAGTTLLYQLLSSHLDVGYVDNLVAAFWKTPLFGARLSSKLITNRQRARSDYSSDFGRTDLIQDPHEFGYFWSRVLGYDERMQEDPNRDEDIDWGYLRRALTNLPEEFGAPMVFKCTLLSWHIDRMLEEVPGTRFVWLRRQPVDNAISILGMREDFRGSRDRWASMRPKEYSELQDRPVPEQLAGQVYHIDERIRSQATDLADDRLLEVRYQELCHQPRDVLEDCRKMLENDTAKVGTRGDPPDSFPHSSYETAERDIYQAIEEAVVDFFEKDHPLLSR